MKQRIRTAETAATGRGGGRLSGKALGAALLLGGTALLGACDDDGNGMDPMVEEATFEVRVENVSQAYDFTSSGIFNTPIGADAPGHGHRPFSSEATWQ